MATQSDIEALKFAMNKSGLPDVFIGKLFDAMTADERLAVHVMHDAHLLAGRPFRDTAPAT